MARILLADDDHTARALVRRALEADGHAVTEAEDGSAALDLLAAATDPVDLLVSDVNMPGLDGISLVRAALAERPGLRVLLMSGFPEELARARALEAARLEVLTKPATLDQVRAAVRALLT